jgi:hypothetical protein
MVEMGQQKGRQRFKPAAVKWAHGLLPSFLDIGSRPASLSVSGTFTSKLGRVVVQGTHEREAEWSRGKALW